MKYDIDDLILLNLAGVGYIRLKGIMEHFTDLKKAFKVGPAALQKITGIGPVAAQKIFDLRDGEGLKREWSLIKEHGVTVLSMFDGEYPENLKNIYDPPLVLYIKGRLTAEDKTAIALVGSRRASFYGTNTCQRLSQSLAGLGLTVVSGLARGIDSAAHRGALKAGGRTLAVLGNGLSAVYPPENGKLASEIADSGAIISEFPMEAAPLPQNFPIRNRIISGLSLGVVIVEAAQRSGALITAACALDEGRDVFAVPGKAGAITSAGTHRLIKEGAKLVDNAEDIIEELNLAPIPPAGTPVRDRASGRGLEGPEKKIYDILSDEPLHIDSIINKSELPIPEVMKTLLRLEVKRLVRELPGKNFVNVN